MHPRPPSPILAPKLPALQAGKYTGIYDVTADSFRQARHTPPPPTHPSFLNPPAPRPLPGVPPAAVCEAGPRPQEVTDVAGGGVRVVVHLYAPGHAECGLVERLLAGLARRNPHTKFARIVYSNAVGRGEGERREGGGCYPNAVGRPLPAVCLCAARQPAGYRCAYSNAVGLRAVRVAELAMV